MCHPCRFHVCFETLRQGTCVSRDHAWQQPGCIGRQPPCRGTEAMLKLAGGLPDIGLGVEHHRPRGRRQERILALAVAGFLEGPGGSDHLARLYLVPTIAAGDQDIRRPPRNSALRRYGQQFGCHSPPVPSGLARCHRCGRASRNPYLDGDSVMIRGRLRQRSLLPLDCHRCTMDRNCGPEETCQSKSGGHCPGPHPGAPPLPPTEQQDRACDQQETCRSPGPNSLIEGACERRSPRSGCSRNQPEVSTSGRPRSGAGVSHLAPSQDPSVTP